jgi:hypothetical protein
MGETPTIVRTVDATVNAALMVTALSSVAFADSPTGWASRSGGILGTTDGGKSWRREWSGSTSVSSLAVVDRLHAWVKSIGYTAEDPNAPFCQRWSGDPTVHLPKGRWQTAQGPPADRRSGDDLRRNHLQRDDAEPRTDIAAARFRRRPIDRSPPGPLPITRSQRLPAISTSTPLRASTAIPASAGRLQLRRRGRQIRLDAAAEDCGSH